MSLDLVYLLTVFLVAIIAGAGWKIGTTIIEKLWK
jgi:hypothetical protein